FYTMDDPENPGTTLSFDLLFRGLEITTGGQRIHDYAMQVAKMKAFGLNPGDFQGYLQAHRYGLPPHGGLAIGLERITARLLGVDNIRLATMFPRDVKRLTP
ncbi:MAG TPA: aspartate--tRNA(Asn) ligase, partial [Candidatus Sabulitectum sp.]|nr:aspartate--tRNA(Asn) ligase [Candidatus Sabulitectum sp.]